MSKPKNFVTKKNTKKIKTILSGGHAVGEAMKQIHPDVMAVYPITPQTPIVEYFAKKKADGEVETEIIPVESEHSAMSACIGASAAGARAVTASSSQGIMYMLEVLPVASGMRLPILMAVANRAISAPINIHGDHSDAMMMRDTGWIQIFSENPQEAYDNTIIGMKIAEEVFLPVAVNFDGFITSHSVENVTLIDDYQVHKFVGEFIPQNHLFDFENPKIFGPVALPDSYFEFRIEIYQAMEKAGKLFNEVTKQYERISGRRYLPIEKYQLSDANVAMVGMGSFSGTAKEAIRRLRKKGIKAGFLKIRLFRPFPKKEIQRALTGVERIIVMDRHLPFGSLPVLAQEIEAIIQRPIESFVYGLGGRDIFQKQLEDIIIGKIEAKGKVKFLL